MKISANSYIGPYKFNSSASFKVQVDVPQVYEQIACLSPFLSAMSKGYCINITNATVYN